MEGGAGGDIPFFCQFCNLLSQSHTVLKNHILTHHHQTDADESKLYSDMNVKKKAIAISFREFNCDLCPKKYQSKYARVALMGHKQKKTFSW